MLIFNIFLQCSIGLPLKIRDTRYLYIDKGTTDYFCCLTSYMKQASSINFFERADKAAEWHVREWIRKTLHEVFLRGFQQQLILMAGGVDDSTNDNDNDDIDDSDHNDDNDDNDDSDVNDENDDGQKVKCSRWCTGRQDDWHYYYTSTFLTEAVQREHKNELQLCEATSTSLCEIGHILGNACKLNNMDDPSCVTTRENMASGYWAQHPLQFHK